MNCVLEPLWAPGSKLNSDVWLICFVFVGFGGPGDGFGGFPVGSKSSGKATTATTKKKATKTTTRTNTNLQNKTKNETKQNEKHRLAPPLIEVVGGKQNIFPL